MTLIRFSSCAAVCAFAVPSLVAAQDIDVATQQEQSGNVIVVTAQKRQESIQDVPLSVTAFSGEQLVNSNVEAMSDLDRLTPGLVVSQSNPARSRVRIRGVGSTKFDVGSDPSIGVFVDEVYVPRFSGMEINLLEVERVEILKGPQGTLFGRNTPGGAISVVSKSTSDVLDGFVEAGFANKGTYTVKGGVSGPLTDNLRASLSFGQEDRGGFTTNTLTGASDDILQRAGRIKLDFEPAATLRIAASLFVTNTESDALLSTQIATLPGGLALPLLAGGANAQYPAPTDPYRVAQDYDGFLESNAIMGILRIEKDIADFTLTSLSSYRDSELDINEDLEKLPINNVRAPVRETSETFSQELRLSGNNFILGIYFYNDDAFNKYTFELYEDSLVFFPPFSVPGPQIDSSITDIETTSWAIFGQYEFQLADALTLTVGARYTDEKKDYRQSAETTPPIGPPVAGAPPVFVPYTFSNTLKFDSFDPKVSLDYKVGDDALLYASFSQGFKSGGVQFTAFSQAISEQTFEPENVDAYEMGFKTEWSDGQLRLNGAAFYYDYKDLQQQRVEIVGGGPAAITKNAANAEIKGIELDAFWSPINAFSLRAAYAYTDGKYKDFIVSPTQDASGNPLPATPKHTLFGSMEYQHTFASDWQLTLGTDWYWTDKQNFDVFDNDPFTKQKGYTTGLVRASVSSPDNRFSLTVYGENITDEEYYDQINRRGGEVIGDIADGARFGVRLRYNFGG